MTAPASTTPLPQPRCTLRQEGHRLLVQFSAPGFVQWTELLADWRRSFVVGRKACYRPRVRCWSVQASQRGRVLEWCTVHGVEIVEVGE